MKAILQSKPGSPDGLTLQEVEKPAPSESQALVKIRAASLNAYDWHLLADMPFFLRPLIKTKGKIPGADIAGQVEAVGSAVTQLRPGDAVYGCIGEGGFAEFACASANALGPKPSNMTFEEAAAVPMAALTALQALRDRGRVSPGQQVLVNGASGGVGAFAVQIAKYYGAEVTAVCSARNVEQARALGADRVIDYAVEDFTRSGRRYDLILGVNGYHSMAAYRRALHPGGMYIGLGGLMGQVIQVLLLGQVFSRFSDKKMTSMLAKVRRDDLVFLKELIEAGKVKSVIERCYPLEEVPEALRYLGQGHARGKITITV